MPLKRRKIRTTRHAQKRNKKAQATRKKKDNSTHTWRTSGEKNRAREKPSPDNTPRSEAINARWDAATFLLCPPSVSRAALKKSQALVEGVRRAEEVVDDVGLVGELFVHHHGKDAHLRGAAVVELDRALGGLGLRGHGVPRGTEGVSPEGKVSREGALNVLHDRQFKEADERDDLREARRGDLREGRYTVRHVSEREVGGVGEHAGQAGVLLGKVAGDGEHSNAAVLDLHIPEALEPLLVGVGQEAERVPEAEGRLGADLGLEGHLHARRRLRRGRESGAVERAGRGGRGGQGGRRGGDRGRGGGLDV